MRAIWFGSGMLATGMALAGVILPLLPTTPFALMATYCFARSSPRLHRWILAHAVLGPLVRDWQNRGAIAPRTKVVAILAMALTFLLSVAISVGNWVLGLQAIILSCAALFILTRPNP